MSDYRKLLVWTKAKALAVSTYSTVRGSAVSHDFGLRDQMLRAAVSIASNIAEGYARETTPDRIHLLTVARGSCAELETQLFIAEEAGLMLATDAAMLRESCDEISRMIYALQKRLRDE